jgi:hypothetical protein
MGWSGIKNGRLLALLTAQGFEAFVTVDQNLKHQQNLSTVGVAILILNAQSNRLADLVPLVPSAVQALLSIKAGDVVEITA